MAQSYFPSRISPVTEASHDLVLAGLHGDRQLKVEDIKEAYIECKDSLLSAIDSTKDVLNDFRAFNKDEWVVRYPQFQEGERESILTQPTTARPKGVRHSLSFADNPTHRTEVVIDRSTGCFRSTNLSPDSNTCKDHDEPEGSRVADISDECVLPPTEFNVIRLDLKLGPHQPSSAASLVSQLEKSSIANLLDERIAGAVNHIEKLRLRVEDTSSKVLVTGDLNAGKSTFVNALLRREVMPIDQQPCTTAFCEVHVAAENDDKEEVHIVKDGRVYDIKNPATYSKADLSELENIVTDNEHTQRMIKLYLADTRAPSESLLNNGVVDISLVDAPGLNRDSIKTTAVFARQEEIDVVVFVVSAENHFTQSAKEFLQTASNEKAYIFIVVNKYDQIRNKDKCRRLVLEQIEQISPGTYNDARDLVHFVDSASALRPFTANPDFDDLEQSLRSFVLVKRSKSKLHPVSTYLSNLLSDIQFLAGANLVLAESELWEAQGELSESRPVLEQLKRGREVLEEALESVEESGVGEASARTKRLLNDALDRIGQGQMGVDTSLSSMPSYPGLFGIWEYTCEVRRALLSSLDAAVILAEDEARLITKIGVNKVKNLGEAHLPAGTERNGRVFCPEAMFSAIRRRGKGFKHRSPSCGNGGAVVAGGLHSLGIGFAQRHDMLETTFFDIFDVGHHIFVHFADGKESEDKPSTPTALGIVSLGVGAVTMMGSQAIGLRGFVEGIVRITDLLGNKTVQKWAAPVLGAATIGVTAYLVLDLPQSIPRTVGRRVRASVLSQFGEQEVHFVDAHASRVSRETRKVLRMASWDLKERHRNATEARTREVKGAEEKEKRAFKAKEWFSDVGRRTREIRADAKLERIGA